MAVITVALGTYITWRRLGARCALLVLAASAVALVTGMADAILGPTLAYEQIMGRGAESFPSGHVAYATAVFGSFACIGWWHGRREVSGVALLLILLTGPASVARGGHVPSDVLGGYLVGAGWLLVCVAANGVDPRVRRSGAS